MPDNRPVTEIIKRRHSCRAYAKKPIAPEQAEQLAQYAEGVKAGPLGTQLRFTLVAAAEGDSRALKGLGTYGLIRNPAGFIIGAAGQEERNLEDFGYSMEAVTLYTTGLGLGTCWLGGNFTKSSFARPIGAAETEIVPAVASVGHPAENSRSRDPLRRVARSDTRLPWGGADLSGRNHLTHPTCTGSVPHPAPRAGRWARRRRGRPTGQP